MCTQCSFPFCCFKTGNGVDEAKQRTGKVTQICHMKLHRKNINMTQNPQGAIKH